VKPDLLLVHHRQQAMPIVLQQRRLVLLIRYQASTASMPQAATEHLFDSDTMNRRPETTGNKVEIQQQSAHLQNAVSESTC
jgi:hypothetical protein